MKHFDAVVQVMPDAEVGAAQQKLLDSFKSAGNGLIKYTDGKRPADAVLREAVLGAVSKKAKSAWEASLASRPPLQRLPGEVPNYERRPEPVKFQAPLAPKDSMRYTQVPADFDLQLFAAEPDVVKPIYMAWDERGRAWVVEARDYPHGLVNEGEPGQADIKICEDTDGDGKADKFTIFADKLNLATSLVFVNGGIMVSEARHMLFLKDTDRRRQGRCAPGHSPGLGHRRHARDAEQSRPRLRQLALRRGGLLELPRQRRRQGPPVRPGRVSFQSGWLRAGIPLPVQQQHLGLRPERLRRCLRLDGQRQPDLLRLSARPHPEPDAAHRWRPAAEGFAGYRLGPDNAGDGNAPQVRRLPSAKSMAPGMRMHPNTPNVRMVDNFGGYTAAAGHAFMVSDALPARLQGKALVTEPTAKLIGIMDIQRDGGGYKARDGVNLLASTDEWMSPIFADVGPDGAVWVIDFYSFIIQHNPTPSTSDQRASRPRPGAAALT